MAESAVHESQHPLAGHALNAGTPMAENKPDQTDHSFPQRKLNRKYHCADCNSYTYDPRTYLEHRQQMHGEVFSIHNCLVCNYASKHPNKVSRHMKMVHQLPAENLLEWRMQLKEFAQLTTSIDSSQPSVSSSMALTDVESKSAVMKMFKCTICHEFETLMRSSLLDHVRQQHGQVDIYNCNLCSYSHYIKDRFRRHVKYHTMDKIRCQICDFETVYKWNMERHMRHHAATGKKNVFACDVCGYAATAKQSITAHKMTHHLDAAGDVGVNFAAGDRKSVDENAADGEVSANVTDYSVFVEGLNQGATVSSAENTANVGSSDEAAAANVNISGNNDDDETLAFNCLQLVWTDCNDTPKGKMEHCKPLSPPRIPSSAAGSSAMPNQPASVGAISSVSSAAPLAFTLDGINISVFKCPYCPFIAQEMSRFHKHFVGHSRTSEYTCSACGFGARFAWDVRRHIIGTHKKANVLSFRQSGSRLGYRDYQEYAETLTIAERSLDESTIVADINVKSKNGSRPLLLGQYLSLNAPLVADNEPALEQSVTNVFDNWLTKDAVERQSIGSKSVNVSSDSWRTRYRCGRCFQPSQWKHVIERHIRQIHSNADVTIEQYNASQRKYVRVDNMQESVAYSEHSNLSATKRRRSKSLDCAAILCQSPKRVKLESDVCSSVDNLHHLRFE